MTNTTNIDVEMIKKLRIMSGAGIVDCKNALTEAKGDVDKAMQILREKGISKVAKKAVREAKNGLISAYIHPGSRIGVLVEVNCETDFVAKTEEFKNIVKELGLQIAAANPLWVKKEDVPPEMLEKEKEIYKKQLEKENKPEKMHEKIILGRVEKYFTEVCLLEQPYIRDPQGKQKVLDLVNDAISKTGENIVVKRFVRYQLGEE